MRERVVPIQPNKPCYCAGVIASEVKLSAGSLMQGLEGETMNVEGQEWIWD